MKTNKWIWWTLTILLTLVVLAGVAGAGFRMGIMQGANAAQNADGRVMKFPFFEQTQRFEKNFNDRPGNNRQPQEFDHPQVRGFDRGVNHGMRHRGFSFLFGLVHLALLGVLLWMGYKLYKKSGWKFVKVSATETETGEIKPDEVKSEGKKKK